MAGLCVYGAETFGGVVPTRIVTAGEAIGVGDPVTIAADGRVEISAAGDQIDGVAATAATADGDKISIFAPDLQYSVVVSGDDAPVESHIGDKVLLVVGGTGAISVLIGTEDTQGFIVEGIVYDNDPMKSGTPAVGDRVYGRFINNTRNIANA